MDSRKAMQNAGYQKPENKEARAMSMPVMLITERRKLGLVKNKPINTKQIGIAAKPPHIINSSWDTTIHLRLYFITGCG
jgi:hypothetical protein